MAGHVQLKFVMTQIRLTGLIYMYVLVCRLYASNLEKYFLVPHNGAKYLDSYIWPKSVDPDQAAVEGAL